MSPDEGGKDLRLKSHYTTHKQQSPQKKNPTLTKNTDLDCLYSPQENSEHYKTPKKSESPSCLQSRAQNSKLNNQKRRTTNEIEEFRAQLNGNIQSVQDMIARAETAQRRRSQSNQKRYQSECGVPSTVLNPEEQRRSELSMSFKSINHVQQDPNPTRQQMPANQSMDTKNFLYNKTPDFRRCKTNGATIACSTEAATQQVIEQLEHDLGLSNEVIVYSDQEDEQSVLKMLQHHPFRGSLSLGTSQVETGNSVVIAEPLKERSLNQVLKQNFVRDDGRRDNQNNSTDYLRQIASLELRLESLQIKNVELTKYSKAVENKNEELTKQVEQYRNKKAMYKNQLESQSKLLRDQQVQLKLMEYEQNSFLAKI